MEKYKTTHLEMLITGIKKIDFKFIPKYAYTNI